MRTDAVQRIRITYSIDGPLKYASLLDLNEHWKRLLRRAEMPLVYSQGYNPRPRLQLASPLPVGYSSECEILDLFLGCRGKPDELHSAMSAQTPQGLGIVDVKVVPLNDPSPQSTMHEARYRVKIWTSASTGEVKRAVEKLLGRESIIRERYRKGRMKEYDLRPLIHDVSYAGRGNDYHELIMATSYGSRGSGRPEEIVDELNLEVERHAIHRFQLAW